MWTKMDGKHCRWLYQETQYHFPALEHVYMYNIHSQHTSSYQQQTLYHFPALEHVYSRILPLPFLLSN